MTAAPPGLARWAMEIVLVGNYRRELMRLVAFLLRYGPKSIQDILSYPVAMLLDISNHIGEIMQEEKDLFDRNLMTGDS